MTRETASGRRTRCVMGPAAPQARDGTVATHLNICRRARLIGLAAAIGAGLAGTSPASAQTNPLTSGPGLAAPSAPAERAEEAAEAQATNPSATAIIRSLAPFADGNPRGGPGRDVRDVGEGPRRLRVDYGRSVDLTVFFAYDSARLTPEARVQLEPLGRALQSPELAALRFLIGGHTDARGSQAYNRRLSSARAEAVKAHLVDAYGVDPARLVTYGWGQRRPKDPSNPLAGVNRRVEVSLVAARTSSFRPEGARIVAGAFETGCSWRPLLDPRVGTPTDLDDFGAAPTHLPCDR